MPQFSFPREGTTDVTDDAKASTTINWILSGFSAANLELTGDRTMKEAWTMVPIRDPHKLALMRCAYQHAVACIMAMQSYDTGKRTVYDAEKRQISEG